MNYTKVKLFDYPTGRICGVFQDNMKPCQLLSEGICFSPIFRRAGSLPFSNQTFNFSNIQTSLAYFYFTVEVEEMIRIVLKHTQYRTEMGKCFFCLVKNICFDCRGHVFFYSHEVIHEPYCLKNTTQRLSGIKIIIQ